MNSCKLIVTDFFFPFCPLGIYCWGTMRLSSGRGGTIKLSSGLRGSGGTECTETGLGVGGGVISSGCLGKTLRHLRLFLKVVGSNSMTSTRTCSGSGRVPAIARARIMQSAVASDRKEAVLVRRVITR